MEKTADLSAVFFKWVFSNSSIERNKGKVKYDF